jgi:hypothetical protein
MNNVKSLSENIAKAVSETTKHVEFLAADYPEIRTNLQTIAETLQVVQHSLGTVCELSEMQEKVHKQTVSEFELEKACKNQAYDFIAAEKLVGRFKTFCECYPTNLHIGLTGVETSQDK